MSTNVGKKWRINFEGLGREVSHVEMFGPLQVTSILHCQCHQQIKQRHFMITLSGGPHIA